MEMADAKHFKEFVNENVELKKMLADEMLKNRVWEESLKKVVSASVKKPLVSSLVESGHCSVRRACRYLSLSRLSRHYRERGDDGKKKLIERIIALSRRYPRYGYRRIRALLMRAE